MAINSFTYCRLVCYDRGAIFFFAFRVWKVSQKNRVATAIIGIFSVAQFSAGLGLAVHLIIVREPSAIYDHIGKLCGEIELISCLVCDVAISSSLVYYFSAFRTGIELYNSKHILRNLIILSVNMGVLLCVLTVITLIVFHGDGGTFISMGPQLVLSKLYVNSLLATLNSRTHFRDLAGRTNEFSLSVRPPAIIHLSPIQNV